MLLRLVIFRLLPFLCFRFCKDRKQVKMAVHILIISYGLCFLVAVWKLFAKEQWKAILYLPISMFPHYLCYGFSIWMLIRCVWSAWSDRVWKRIYNLSVIGVILGILAENYVNPQILQFFFEIFK